MDTQERLDELYTMLEEVERKFADVTLSDSEQQLLNQAWETLKEEIDEIEEELPPILDERCARCIGCIYCLDTGTYDPSGEI